MALVVPDELELEILQDLLNTPISMRLYGNNKTPASGDTVAAYTEIAGGGYAAKALIFAGWNFTQGTPTIAIYNTSQQWVFTGIIDAPGTIYGYYVTRDSDNQLLWADRFPAGLIPFAPISGSQIRVLPRFTLQSEFV